MTYPFPGMNPYLEHKNVWHDFHNGLTVRIRDQLVPQIRPRYLTKVDENVYIHELSAEERFLMGRPDVAVVQGDSPVKRQATGSDACLPLAEGLLIPAVDQVKEPFIEIRDGESRELITVIELLSPTNKRPGADRDQYVSKRRRILNSTVNLVEIDLLRGGARMEVEGLPQADYAMMVSRYEDRPKVGLWPIRLEDRLPKIPVPLTADDPDAVLDLQQLVEAQFEAAGYEDYIYQHTPQPPLNSYVQTWADKIRGIS